MAKKKIRKVSTIGSRGEGKTSPITIALSKGALFDGAIALFQKAGYKISVPPKENRELSFTDSSGRLKFLIVRATDVPVYVEQGAVDLGVAGKDVLEEGMGRVAELLDLGFGGCQLVLAAPQAARIASPQDLPTGARIATTYPRLTEQYFSRLEKPVEIVKLYGSVELAPSSHIADAITDLTATGKTLKQLQLKIIDVLLESTARLIANPVRWKVRYKEIWELCSELSVKTTSTKKSRRS